MRLSESPEIVKKLSTYASNVEKISEMNITIIPLTNKLLKKSSRVRLTEGLLTNDSLMIAAMRDLKLTNLATNDSDFDRLKWLRVYKPADL